MHAIQIIGVGRVGSSVAFGILSRDLGHVILTDVDMDRLDAEFYDLSVYARHVGLDEKCYVRRSADLLWADIYVFCCGKSRKSPIETRESLFGHNWSIIKPYVERISVLNPEAWILIISNPSTQIAKECMSYIPRVIPMGLLTDRIEDLLSSVHGFHESNIKEDIGLQIFKTKGGSAFGICGEVVATIEKLEE
jgi:malate/lactate dehydrogenase